MFALEDWLFHDFTFVIQGIHPILNKPVRSIGILIGWWMSVVLLFSICGCQSWLPHTSWVGRSIERKTCKLVGFLSYPSEGQFPWQGFQSALTFTTLAESENGVVGERVDKWKSINIVPFVGSYFSTLTSLFCWLWGKGCNPWIHEWVFKKLEDVCQTYELARFCKWKAVVFLAYNLTIASTIINEKPWLLRVTWCNRSLVSRSDVWPPLPCWFKFPKKIALANTQLLLPEVELRCPLIFQMTDEKQMEEGEVSNEKPAPGCSM